MRPFYRAYAKTPGTWILAVVLRTIPSPGKSSELPNLDRQDAKQAREFHTSHMNKFHKRSR